MIYSITKQVRTCICYCEKNNRLAPADNRPVNNRLTIGHVGLLRPTWIYRLAWIQILDMNSVNLFDFITFGHKFTYSLSRFHT